MKVIVIEDGEHIEMVPDDGEGVCNGCVFHVFEPNFDRPELITGYCIMDSNTKLPCVGTIYAVVQDTESD